MSKSLDSLLEDLIEKVVGKNPPTSTANLPAKDWPSDYLSEANHLIQASSPDSQIHQRLKKTQNQIRDYFLTSSSSRQKLLTKSKNKQVVEAFQEFTISLEEYVSTCKKILASENSTALNHHCPPRCKCDLASKYRDYNGKLGLLINLADMKKKESQNIDFVTLRNETFQDTANPFESARGKKTININIVSKPSDLVSFVDKLMMAETKILEGIYAAKTTAKENALKLRLEKIQTYLSKVILFSEEFGFTTRTASRWAENSSAVKQFYELRQKYLGKLTQPYAGVEGEGKEKYSLTWIYSPQRALIVASSLITVCDSLHQKTQNSDDSDLTFRYQIANKYLIAMRDFCSAIGLEDDLTLIENGSSNSWEYEKKYLVTPSPTQARSAPWKLSVGAVVAIRESGYPVPDDIGSDAYDQRMYGLDAHGQINSSFLGLDSSKQYFMTLYDLIFDEEGLPKCPIDDQNFVEEGGNIVEELTPRGLFTGTRQRILRTGDVKSLLTKQSIHDIDLDY